MVTKRVDSEQLSSRTNFQLEDQLFILVLYANRMQIGWTDSLLE